MSVAYAEEAMKELVRAQDALDVNTIVRVLNGAARVHANVAARACRAVAIVCDGGGPISTALGELGACESFVDVSRMWGETSEEAAWMACFAVGRLANRSPSNCARLLACGACECVVDALTRWGTRSDNVAHNGCYAVYNLANETPAFRVRLLRVGAVEAVTAARENRFTALALNVLDVATWMRSKTTAALVARGIGAVLDRNGPAAVPGHIDERVQELLAAFLCDNSR